MITNQEIINKADFIKPTEIHTAFCNAINNNKPHTARMITEQLREMAPRSRRARDLDTMVMMRYFN